ncbi:hypothetical protein BJ138DRAFT_1117190 [Hygrophoropsis aurantiaca]|uniref:Uncharacterized protein n=1 Tax=Hygrophoropsis aurantiaca TaxID=72124 RepID=A0ACB8A0W1_9AGAM|nr:hypothetical protein BJ138DRAFT_1117190 [Hygrophoropsis aurantiaca]
MQHTNTARQKVLSSHYLLSEILSYLSLPDIIDKMKHINRIFEMEARHTAVARFASIVRPYIGDHVHALVDLLRENRGIITGSCALKMLLPHQKWQPNNLNIIVPRNAVNIFLTFFNSKQYSPTQVAIAPHLTHYASRVFRCDHLTRSLVTITESKDSSALTPFLASSCTTEFICMTGGGLADIYPDLSARRVALQSPRSSMGVPSVTRTLATRGFVVKTTTEHVPHDPCPIAWRRINGLRGIWIEDWDEGNTIKDVFLGEHHRWRLDTECMHPACRESREM